MDYVCARISNTARASANVGKAGGSKDTAVADLLRLAASEAGCGRYDAAAGYYQDVLRVDGDNFEALSGIGHVFISTERYDEALNCFRSALLANPRAATALVGMGDLCMRLGECEKAVKAYDRAIASDPGQKDGHTGRGEALKNLGQFDEAARSFDAALRCDGDDGKVLFMLAECMFASGRHRDALHFFGRARKMSLDMAAVLNHNMGGCLSVLGRHEEAIGCYEKALDLDEYDWDSALGIGCSLAAMGRNDAAIAEFTHMSEDGPDDIAVQALVQKARILDAMGRADDAIAACDEVIALDECCADALLHKGRMLARTGRKLAAMTCIAAAKQANPGHKGARRAAVAVSLALKRDGKMPWMWDDAAPRANAREPAWVGRRRRGKKDAKGCEWGRKRPREGHGKRRHGQRTEGGKEGSAPMARDGSGDAQPP